ncbi:MAG: hypothetical protein WCG97_02590 [bacterium]
MKNKSFVLATLALILTLLSLAPSSLWAGIKAEGREEQFTINFYNAGDTPPRLPFLRIIFINVPEKNKTKILEWQKKMDEKFKDIGGVSDDAGYKKMSKIVEEYAIGFMAMEAKSVIFYLPRTGEFIAVSLKDIQK